MSQSKNAADPIFGMIEKHVTAYAVMTRAFDAQNKLERTGPNKTNRRGFEAAERRANVANSQAHNLLWMIAIRRPTSAEGMAAKLRYLHAREMQADGGKSFNTTGLLDALSHVPAFLVRKPYSERYQRVLNHVAAVIEETKARAAERRAFRKTPEYREMFKSQMKGKRKRERKPSKFSMAVDKRVSKVLRGFANAFDPSPAEPKKAA